eukprot:3438163-Rhodomonas_salina.1
MSGVECGQPRARGRFRASSYPELTRDPVVGGGVGEGEDGARGAGVADARGADAGPGGPQGQAPRRRPEHAGPGTSPLPDPSCLHTNITYKTHCVCLSLVCVGHCMRVSAAFRCACRLKTSAPASQQQRKNNLREMRRVGGAARGGAGQADSAAGHRPQRAPRAPGKLPMRTRTVVGFRV